jgi:hypothetical protein
LGICGNQKSPTEVGTLTPLAYAVRHTLTFSFVRPGLSENVSADDDKKPFKNSRVILSVS